jgi:hypothetical protein
MILFYAHQAAGDPFGFHEFLLIAAAGGGAAIIFARMYIVKIFNKLRTAAVAAWLRLKGY